MQRRWAKWKTTYFVAHSNSFCLLWKDNMNVKYWTGWRLKLIGIKLCFGIKNMKNMMLHLTLQQAPSSGQLMQLRKVERRLSFMIKENVWASKRRNKTEFHDKVYRSAVEICSYIVHRENLTGFYFNLEFKLWHLLSCNIGILYLWINVLSIG